MRNAWDYNTIQYNTIWSNFSITLQLLRHSNFFYFSEIHVMLTGVTLIVKVNWKRKTCFLQCNFEFQNNEFDWNMTT